MNVGFIGLGHLGSPMSRDVLAAGHYLVVHDVRREAAAAGQMLPVGLGEDPPASPPPVRPDRGQ